MPPRIIPPQHSRHHLCQNRRANGDGNLQLQSATGINMTTLQVHNPYTSRENKDLKSWSQLQILGCISGAGTNRRRPKLALPRQKSCIRNRFVSEMVCSLWLYVILLNLQKGVRNCRCAIPFTKRDHVGFYPNLRRLKTQTENFPTAQFSPKYDNI